MIQKMLDRVAKDYILEEKNPGAFARIKVSGMTFEIKSFYAKGLGHVSAMRAKGFCGLMKMDTFIINPVEKDMPLYSYDRVLAMGNDTLIEELYDTLLNPLDMESIREVVKRNIYLPDHDLGSHWYDTIKLVESVSKKGRKMTEKFDALASDYFEAYMGIARDAMGCTEAGKKEKAKIYVEGLLENGGPSTDIFKKHFGEERTAELFRKVLFGIE